MIIVATQTPYATAQNTSTAAGRCCWLTDPSTRIWSATTRASSSTSPTTWASRPETDER